MTDFYSACDMKRLVLGFLGIVGAWLPTIADEPEVMATEYWFDNNIGQSVVVPSTEFRADCTSLFPGVHVLRYRLMDSNGEYSMLHEHYFVRVLPSGREEIEKIQYWWDDDESSMVERPYQSDVFVLSASHLMPGLHSLKYRVVNKGGNMSELHTHYFFRTVPGAQTAIVSYTYWWNNLAETATTVSLDSPSTEFMLEDRLILPMEAKIKYLGLNKAELNIAFTDARGHTVLTSAPVEFSEDSGTLGVTDVFGDSVWTVGYDGLEITVENALEGTVYTVYDLNGGKVRDARANAEGKVRLQVDTHGVYLVTDGKKIEKILAN